MIEAPWRLTKAGGSCAGATTWGQASHVPAVQIADAFNMGFHLGRKDARGWPHFGLLIETVRNFYLRTSVEEAVAYALGWTDAVRGRAHGETGALMNAGEDIRLGKSMGDTAWETRAMMGSCYKGYVFGRRRPDAKLASCLDGIRQEAETVQEALAFAVGWIDAIRKQPLRDENYMLFFQAMPDEALFKSIPAYFMVLPEDVAT